MFIIGLHSVASCILNSNDERSEDFHYITAHMANPVGYAQGTYSSILPMNTMVFLV
jgi:hypothetical protein